MKKLLWLVSLVAVLALTAVPATAEGENHRYRWEGERFALTGVVTEVDAGAKTITVLVHRGSRVVKEYIGEELLITTVERTRFLHYAEPTCEKITFGEIQKDDRVGIIGYKVEDDFLAKRVIVDIPLRFLG